MWAWRGEGGSGGDAHQFLAAARSPRAFTTCTMRAGMPEPGRVPAPQPQPHRAAAPTPPPLPAAHRHLTLPCRLALPSSSMEEAYMEALDKIGGLEKAKPKAVWELLHPQFPELDIAVGAGGRRAAWALDWTSRTAGAALSCWPRVVGAWARRCCAAGGDAPRARAAARPQRVKWHILSHRRRAARHRKMEPEGFTPPTKWTGRRVVCLAAAGGSREASSGGRGAPTSSWQHRACAHTASPSLTPATARCPLPFSCLLFCCRLEAAYEAEVARLGGLHAARPKQLLDALLPDFPDLTLQVVKW